MLVITLHAETALTSVSGDEIASVAEVIDGQKTMVVTVRTPAHGRVVIKLQNLIHGKHAGRAGFIRPFSGNQRGAESAHNAGNIRTDCMAAGDSLEGTKNSVIIKCSALYDDLIAQLFRICQLDNLQNGIFDD